ncbi:hypothetical protein Tcan_15537 [Toxocara canis]|uniref:Uncharacterized protein n=1 Tax=Toxocara canis TaxID=6265 RepID=A0A0B2VWU2_TOXCA|nr:hypothetical protein Tcan_15537 [Toxocara canis]
MMENNDPAKYSYFEVPQRASEQSFTEQEKDSKDQDKKQQTSAVSLGAQLTGAVPASNESNKKPSKRSMKGKKKKNMCRKQIFALIAMVLLVSVGLLMTVLLGAVALSDCFGIQQCPIVSFI